ncbi:MAG: pilus assembly protein N-terminal domain-containing protein [Devosia sp.]|uniref:pilus assembly protein N-terminal domain-containing protein n=1 Tax=Devosia sp. TaxID=1871048 RepID=UPI001AD222A6|nr:pilus assembly protein N-terminal domain-containing protein [Devosia sp.]MBN9314886.1 pilus assembly protein N-terminal domain-containing protein [Devosia sp.]
MSFRSSLAAFLALPMLMAPALALAETAPVSVKVNMARILRISAPASTVIIGNPAIADVTIQDPQTLVLTGKAYGQTNLIVLDGKGSPIADTMVEVVQDMAGVVTVYLGNKRTSLACEPTCQPTIMLGDDSSFTSDTISASKSVESAAQ